MLSSDRARHEIEHGRKLALGDTESIWGWGTPAGKLRLHRRAEMISEGAGLRAGSKALEIGCGTGQFTELFARSGAQIVAVDISPDLLERARERNLPADLVRFVNARFEEGPDADFGGPFDAVIGSSVLHHLEVEPSVARIFELLRPGGVLSFAEPNLLNPQVYLERRFHYLPMFSSYVSPDETAFVRWRLARLLGRVGFVDVSLVPHDWLHPATPTRLIGAVKALGELLEKTPLVRELAGSIYIRARRPG